MRQHTTLLQSLYSTKAGVDQAAYYDYAISQARADVFFSLLFGGRIMAAAGAFFDSTIAVRVFGELFSHPGFAAVCADYGWRPLCLNTDGEDRLTPVQFLTGRWRNPKSTFTFFRQPNRQFWQDDEAVLRVRAQASEALERGEFGRFSNVVAPLFADHLLSSAPAGAAGDGLRQAPARLPAVLTPDVGGWMKAILDYLKLDGAFEYLRDAKCPEAFRSFAPVDAVIARTNALPEGDCGDFDREELIQLNEEFKSKMAPGPSMNPYHIAGPSHYGHYFQLVNYWVETEWHATRHRMYGSDVCTLSSDWSMRSVFDFDPRSKVTYLSDIEVDDALRVEQEGFAEIDWEVLFSVVTDARWSGLVDQLHEASEPEAQRRTAGAILDLLAARMTDFTFESDKGRVSILKKRGAKVTAAVGYVGMVAKYHSTLEGLFGANPAWGLVAGAPFAHDALRFAAPAARPAVKGLRYMAEKYEAMRLRRAIVPKIYLGLG